MWGNKATCAAYWPVPRSKVRVISVPRLAILRVEVWHPSAKALGIVPIVRRYLGRLYEVACMKNGLQRGTGKCGVGISIGPHIIVIDCRDLGTSGRLEISTPQVSTISDLSHLHAQVHAFPPSYVMP
ncbi:hypothetical protein PCH_Pc16g11880 [Penicillium rubens Wisconsin 54-1255]|uniref:Uncharacterized protein n=1 Tax=Penicillium rubens (strain ATCC 28089 / DSM 1075 / NRRL 1951 / Wisconsin 54-1255) TaxID=500485 RepID=B6H9Q8_PENRW|nr:hypothetical protein PCH_Pc16g11880 [Penicillium rubens Wisconsin 54-1255]